MMSETRILVVDDHAVVRRGVTALVEEQPGWTVCGEAATGTAAVAAAARLKPDVVILDLGLPELNGLEVARRILKELPRTEILVLTMHHSDELVQQVLQAGARGYLLKSDAGERLVAAVESLRRHEPYLTSAVAELVLDRYLHGREPSGDREDGGALTPREREILQLVAEGNSTKAIAASLDLAVKTVESHRSNLMHKLGLQSVTELVRYAVRNGVVEA